MSGDPGATGRDATAGGLPQGGVERAAGVVKPAGAVEARPVPAGVATRLQVLVGPEDGAPNFVLRRFVMGEDGGIPTHTNRVEHEQYVLRGRARVGIGDRVYEVRQDDALYIPAGVPHSYEVVEAPFEFLCIVPHAPDEIRLQAAPAPPATGDARSGGGSDRPAPRE